MAKTRTTYYRADLDTNFYWADAGTDPFKRDTDLQYLARAVEMHDHRESRGRAVGRLDAGVIDAAAFAPNSVTATAIADGAVGNGELADNAVTSAKILDGTIKGTDMEPTAISDRLGYIPINKAGDTEIGSLSFGKVGPPATSSILTFLNAGGINIASGGITSAGSIYVTRTAAGACIGLSSSIADSIIFQVQNSASTPGYSLGILNAAASGWDFILSHLSASFGVPVSTPNVVSTVAVGTPPFAATSTTLCTNLNANFLNGHPDTDFAPAANKVPALVHAFVQTAALIPAGWARNTAGDGRLIVGAGASGVPGVAFGENAQAGGSWSAGGGAHTHSLAAHSHFLSNVPNSTGAPGPAGQYVALGTTTSPEGPLTTGETGGSSSWNYPTYGLVLIYKT